MATEAREIHIHLTAQPGTAVHVTIRGDDVIVTGGDEAGHAEPGQIAPDAKALEDAIQRLEGANISRHIRAAVRGLQDLGYELRPARTRIPGKRPENYLRIMDPGYAAHGIGYLTPGNFSFTRAMDRDSLARRPGARVLGSEVAFSHVQTTEPGLAAARLLKA